MKTTCKKSWPGNLSQVLNLTFDPCFKVKWGHLTTKALYLSLCYPLLLILRREITTAAVVLFSLLFMKCCSFCWSNFNHKCLSLILIAWYSVIMPKCLIYQRSPYYVYNPLSTFKYLATNRYHYSDLILTVTKQSRLILWTQLVFICLHMVTIF